MIQKNKKISSLQILIIGSMIGNALFVGMGNIITVLTVKNNTWFVGLCSLVLGIIPILLLNLYISYKPELNVIEKNKALFGKFFGTIINIILVIAVFIMFLINIWSFFNFAGTKYLTETPVLFIGFLFIIPLIYACTKGIETIARTIFILFFLSLIIHIIITSALFKFVNIENLKPILQIKPERIILAIKNFITYAFTPFITLTMIPKNDIVDRKKLEV
jgi:spore germination protein KB